MSDPYYVPGAQEAEKLHALCAAAMAAARVLETCPRREEVMPYAARILEALAAGCEHMVRPMGRIDGK